MTVNIGKHECAGLWDHVYYFALSDYPNISDWELRKLICFCDYEKKHGRKTKIACKKRSIVKVVRHAFANPALFIPAQKPQFIPGYTACGQCKQKGCLTEFLCHTTNVESAKSIFRCGRILSAVNARNQPAAALAEEPRNAAGDPPDYFDYVMLNWGNCQAGDRLVMERMLGRFPDERNLSVGFQPGIRFYFAYNTIAAHKDFTEDGCHAAKIKDALALAEYLYCCVIPSQHKAEFEDIVPGPLAERVFYLENDCGDIWEWSDKVYGFVSDMKISGLFHS